MQRYPRGIWVTALRLVSHQKICKIKKNCWYRKTTRLSKTKYQKVNTTLWNILISQKIPTKTTVYVGMYQKIPESQRLTRYRMVTEWYYVCDTEDQKILGIKDTDVLWSGYWVYVTKEQSSERYQMVLDIKDIDTKWQLYEVLEIKDTQWLRTTRYQSISISKIPMSNDSYTKP